MNTDYESVEFYSYVLEGESQQPGPAGREEALDLLATRLQALPAIVHEPRTVSLGLYRGLRFGLDLHPHDAPRVSVEGATTRFGTLSREFHGARGIERRRAHRTAL